MSGRFTLMVLAGSIVAGTMFAPSVASAKKYKNCHMDYRFRPPMRTCDDPTPYRKPKPQRDIMLEPIRSPGPSPFGPPRRR